MKKKLSLDSLKVQSFVTSANAANTLGGAKITAAPLGKVCDLLTGNICNLQPQSKDFVCKTLAVNDLGCLYTNNAVLCVV